MPSDLLIETRKLLVNRPTWLTLPKIARECSVSSSWLVAIRAGTIKSPGVEFLERLRNYLIAKGKQQK